MSAGLRTTILWSDVISPAAIRSRSFDAIVVASVSRNPIRQQLRDLGVGGAQILAPEMTASTDRVRLELLALLGRLAPAARAS